MLVKRKLKRTDSSQRKFLKASSKYGRAVIPRPVFPPGSKSVGVADHYRCLHRYASYTTHTTAGGVYDQVYNLTSLYDPDFSGVGSQPQNRDALAGMYSYYSVIGTKVRIHFINSAAEIVNVLTMLTSTSSSQAATNTSDNLVQNYKQFKLVQNTGVSGSFVIFPWTQYPGNCTSKEAKTPRNSIDNTLYAASGANPTYNKYLHIVMKNFTAANLNTKIFVEIIYDAVWFNRELTGMD